MDQTAQALLADLQAGAQSLPATVRSLTSLVSKDYPGLREVNEVGAGLARKQAALLVGEISATKKKNVASLVARALDFGWSDATLAKKIAEVVGLDTRYAQAVENFHKGRIKAGTPKGKAAKEAAAYASRLRKHRAGVIARNEVQTVLLAAQRLLWAQQQQDGDVSRYAVRVTRLHQDEKLCGQCRKENGRRRSLKVPTGGPPFHPACRCWEEIEDQGVVKTDPALWGDGPVEIAKDRVKTPAGARRFKLPIGAQIIFKPKKPLPKATQHREYKPGEQMTLGLDVPAADPDMLRASQGRLRAAVAKASALARAYDRRMEYGDDDYYGNEGGNEDQDSLRAQNVDDESLLAFAGISVEDTYEAQDVGEALAMGEWTKFGVARQMREMAYALLGYDPDEDSSRPADPHLQGGRPNWGGIDAGISDAEGATALLLQQLAQASAQDRPLYRGVNLHGADPDDFIASLRENPSFDLPVASFADNRKITSPFGTDVTFILRSGARAVRGFQMDQPDYADEYDPEMKEKFGWSYEDWSKYDEEYDLREWVTGGRFKVLRVQQSKEGGILVHIRQDGVFDLDRGGVVRKGLKKAWRWAWMFDKSLAEKPQGKVSKGTLDRVRTMAGSRRFHLPLGAPIVARPKNPFVQAMHKAPYEGWTPDQQDEYGSAFAMVANLGDRVHIAGGLQGMLTTLPQHGRTGSAWVMLDDGSEKLVATRRMRFEDNVLDSQVNPFAAPDPGPSMPSFQGKTLRKLPRPAFDHPNYTEWKNSKSHGQLFEIAMDHHDPMVRSFAQGYIDMGDRYPQVGLLLGEVTIINRAGHGEPYASMVGEWDNPKMPLRINVGMMAYRNEPPSFALTENRYGVSDVEVEREDWATAVAYHEFGHLAHVFIVAQRYYERHNAPKVSLYNIMEMADGDTNNLMGFVPPAISRYAIKGGGVEAFAEYWSYLMLYEPSPELPWWQPWDKYLNREALHGYEGPKGDGMLHKQAARVWEDRFDAPSVADQYVLDRAARRVAKAGRLDWSPKKNWVDKAGGLPRYIEDIALALMRDHGYKRERAIPVAVNRVKMWAVGGGGVKPDTQAKAAKAVAEWEKMKAKTHAKDVAKGEDKSGETGSDTHTLTP